MLDPGSPVRPYYEELAKNLLSGGGRQEASSSPARSRGQAARASASASARRWPAWDTRQSSTATSKPAPAQDARRAQLRRPHQRPQGREDPGALRARRRAGAPGRPHGSRTPDSLLGGGSSRWCAASRRARSGDPRRSGSQERPEVQNLSKGFDGVLLVVHASGLQEHGARDHRRPARRWDKPPGRGFERIVAPGGAVVKERVEPPGDAVSRAPTQGDQGERAAERGACSLSSRPSSC